MLDARNVYRKVTRKIYDFSPEQMKNLAAIVWLYRGQRQRFLGLIKDYLTRVRAEGFEPIAESIRGMVKQVDLLYKLSARAADLGAELSVALAAASEAAARNAQPSPEGTRPTSPGQRPGSSEKDAQALKGRDTDAPATNGKLPEPYDRRAANREVKQLEEARKAAVEQMRQALYFHRQVLWLQDRFPDADGEVPIYGSTGPVGLHSKAMVQGPGVVTGRSGTLGQVHYVAGEFWPLNTSLWVKEFKTVTPLFALFLLRAMQLQQYNGGVSVPTLDRKTVHKATVLVPSKRLLSASDEFAAPLFEQLSNLNVQIGKLRAARDLLLPRLMSGELAV